ncbi:MAG: 6-hydroxymethylpterin diphosphokinase MptE-like protein [Dehalococcoidia bacterium]
MSHLTALKSVDLALANTRINLEYLDRTIADLANTSRNGRCGSAVIITAGPSLHRRNPVAQILSSGYEGDLICADGALAYCLRNGLVPNYVVTLDPHPRRIVRWFGDPHLDESSLAEDDYFSRQDLDPYMGLYEITRNRQVIELVNKHGPEINAVIATCVSLSVTKRCLDAAMRLYWWNPLYDDFRDPASLARQVYNLNKVPCMASGGNCGSAAWVFANAVLKKKEIAVVGMDFSYAPGTPLEKTQYYKEVAELFGNEAPDAFVDVVNPYLQEVWFTDPAYYWYRETFLEMARDADCATYNCTEGGILFGEGVEFAPLNSFLERWADSRGGV